MVQSVGHYSECCASRTEHFAPAEGVFELGAILPTRHKNKPILETPPSQADSGAFGLLGANRREGPSRQSRIGGNGADHRKKAGILK